MCVLDHVEDLTLRLAAAVLTACKLHFLMLYRSVYESDESGLFRLDSRFTDSVRLENLSLWSVASFLKVALTVLTVRDRSCRPFQNLYKWTNRLPLETEAEPLPGPSCDRKLEGIYLYKLETTLARRGGSSVAT